VGRDLEALSGDVIDVAMRLHRQLGPGLLESVYEILLAGKLAELGFTVARQKLVDIEFESVRIAGAFRVDLIVEGCLLIEVKSVERLLPLHGKQLLTYLRLMQQPVGLLINFGGETLKEGLRRVVNDYRPSAPPRLRVNQSQWDG
jgi:iron complex transport system substrate-binding protein